MAGPPGTHIIQKVGRIALQTHGCLVQHRHKTLVAMWRRPTGRVLVVGAKPEFSFVSLEWQT